MSNEFFNPFHFVPVEKPALAMMPRQELAKTPPERKEHRHVTHDRYLTSDGVYSGRIVCKLTLVTPTVVGARRDASTSPAVVAPYEVLAEHGAKLRLEPALPETSLRGMISSVFESATNSALRVLNDRALSVRQEVPEAMQAVGMIRERNGARYILPLALPLLKSDSTVPAELRPFARQMQLKCYFNGFSEEQSSTADSHAIYFAKLTYSEVNLQGRVFAPDLLSRGSAILGRRSASVTRLMSYQQWSQLPTEERKAYVPGVLRNLGRFSLPELQQLRDEVANEERSPGKVLPTNVKHRWFIPLRPSLYDPETNTWKDEEKNWIAADVAIDMFERMARERTLDDVRLPFEVHGSMRNDTLREFSKNRCSQSHDNEAHVIRLRDGDLVCFRSDASQLAISSIWRKSAGTVWDWFAQIDPNLLPMNSAREQVTLAEQLFGFVQADKLEQKDGRIKALAGRVRFSAGRMCNAAIARGAYEPEGTTPILSSPKPPSPTLYFHNRGQAVKKSNLPARAGGTIRPLGRKWYLHHHRQHLRWTSVAPGTNSHQKARIRPLKAGLEFIFDIDFTNLSQIELAFLVYALRPSGDFHHRLGSGKPLGLGTVRIDPLGIFFVDRQQRYTPDDFLTANRYHRAAICDKAQKVELELRLAADDVRRRYVRELAAWSLPSGEGATWQSLYDQALQLLSDQHLKLAGAKAAIEALGNPATVGNAPVHYPRLPDELLPRSGGQPDHESELFRWHQWNEERPSPQALKPLTSDDPNPRPLQKIAPFAFFVYSGLNAQQREQVYDILASAYPGRVYPDKPDTLASTPEVYRTQILDAQKQGLICVHLGYGPNLPSWAEQVKNHAPLAAADRSGRPIDFRYMLRKYVPLLSGTGGTRTNR